MYSQKKWRGTTKIFSALGAGHVPLTFTFVPAPLTKKDRNFQSFCPDHPRMGALQGAPGAPWPTQNFCWVGHNAFGPLNNCLYIR